MLNIVSILLLVFMGFLAWKAWNLTQRKPIDTSLPAANSHDLERVLPGAMIRLPAHGDQLDPLDVQITARHLYDQDGYQWLELQGDSEKGTVWLDVENEDELYTSVTLKRLSLEEIGMDADQLSGLKTGRGTPLEYHGITFHLEEKGTALFCPNGDRSQGQKYEYWDFEGSDRHHDLAIERWNDDIRVYLSQRLSPSRITIYSLGEPA